MAQNHSKAVYWYQKAADQNYESAEVALGYCYEMGQGVSKDMGMAFRLYLRGAQHGDDVGMNNVANCYYNGWGTSQNYTEAFNWYLKAAEKGDTNALNMAGECYYYGRGTAKNLVKAASYYQRAAEKATLTRNTTLGIATIKAKVFRRISTLRKTG